MARTDQILRELRMIEDKLNAKVPVREIVMETRRHGCAMISGSKARASQEAGAPC